MKDQNADVFLNTPLLVLGPREESRSKSKTENILRVTGKIVEESAAGVVVAVKSVGSEKEIEKNIPFEKVFIPFHKVDSIILG